MKIPFSVYDFFGYLIAGFLLLATFDYAYDGAHIVAAKPEALVVTFWTVVAYILGQLVAGFSSAILEHTLTRRGLGPSEDILLKPRSTGLRASVLFRGYFNPLPAPTVKDVLVRAQAEGGDGVVGRALFFQCWRSVKKDAAAMERLNSFLNLYGFARNVCLSLLVCDGILIVRWIKGGSDLPANLPLAIMVAVMVAICLYYRYLKFYRAYGQDVYISYSAGALPEPEGQSKP